jgi:hypothetical protein
MTLLALPLFWTCQPQIPPYRPPSHSLRGKEGPGWGEASNPSTEEGGDPGNRTAASPLPGGSQMLADGRTESAETSLQKRKVELKKNSNSPTS